MTFLDLKIAGLALAAALATSAATLAATGAVAATPIVVEGAPAPSARVHTADLNLLSAAGVRRLNARVRGAAERLCVEPGTKSLQAVAEGKACLRVAVDRAQPQIQRVIELQSAAQVGAGGK